MNQRKRTNSSGLHLNHPAFTLVELLVVIACMRKLLLILNAILKENKPWNPNHTT